MPFKDYYWIVTNVKYSIACCFFFTLQCTKIKVFKWFLTIWLYLTRQYSIFHLVFASINPHKEYCQMQSQKILNNRDYFPCKNTLLLMHKVMWLLITTIRYCLEINDFLLPIMFEKFFCQPVHALGKVLQELDLQEFAQFFACSQPSPDSTLPEWGNRWQQSQMTTTETSFLLDDSQIIDSLWSYYSHCSLGCHPWCQ